MVTKQCQMRLLAAGVVAVAMLAVATDLATLYAEKASAAADTLTVTGVATNHSSAKVYFQPVAGARDYRIYDAATPTDVKYAGMAHLTASAACPGPYCLNHFVAQADGATPVFPYQVVDGPTGGPQVLDVPATDIEWNSLGDRQPHTLVVEAVDQLGPVPQANTYTGLQNLAILSPSPPGAMLGSNRGRTADGNLSTNGQGPFTSTPQVLARSEPFVVQARADVLAIPSVPGAVQPFFDTFENAENATITRLTRDDGNRDAAGNLGSMTYSLNSGTPKEWAIEFRQTDNTNSMPFIASDHFMDMVFDGASPGTSAPPHTLYGSMSMTPRQTIDIAGGKALHLTMEVDGHQSFRRWLAFDLAPASDPLQAWDAGGHAINASDHGIFVEIRDGGCTLDIFNGPKSASDRVPTGSAGGSAHGARLWGQAGSVGGAPIMCGGGEMYNPGHFSKNGFGLDDRNRFDFFLTQDHAALFEDGQLIVQSDIPPGSFPWANEPLKAYYSHYLYHSDADIVDLKSFKDNGAGLCYPLNSYWFNNPLLGTAAGSNVCNASYPAGYGFPFSDERHWDNMGFEVLAGTDVPATRDFSSLASAVQPPQVQAPQFSGAGSTDPNLPAPTTTPPIPATVTPAIDAPTTDVPATDAPAQADVSAPTSMVMLTPRLSAGAPSPQTGKWVNVTPATANLSDPLDCSNFGASNVVADPARPSDLYAHFDCQGIWKSTDFGQTWTGPINTGPGGSGANSAGGIAIAPGSGSDPPILYSSGIRGSGTGFWRSTDGGVSWTNSTIGPAGGRQDVYPASVDPYDGAHLIMAAHELNAVYQSVDGGQSWSSVALASGMNQPGGTAGIFFINTGDASTTRNTWLWMAQGSGGSVGTWRTTSGGASWTKVDSNEHPHGAAQIYQPDTNGVVYMAGIYSAGGWGVIRSTDYGAHWAHVGTGTAEALVFGTPSNVYSMYGWACLSCDVNPDLQVAPQPGMADWKTIPRPAGMRQGPNSAAVAFDGTQYIVVTANYNSGLWRYAEPQSGVAPSPAAPAPTSVPPPPPLPPAVPQPTPMPTEMVSPDLAPADTPADMMPMPDDTPSPADESTPPTE
ncbi:MAG TPA: sialidase family protein [Chloroflexota bacterium]|nr:sialidase family protein [Chloroflexota bacterium]